MESNTKMLVQEWSQRSRQFPKALIRYVAKTGYITKPLWQDYFFSGGKARWRYQAWSDLSRRGYFKSHPFRRLKNVYVLNRYNKEVIDCVQGRAASPPALAQLDHDESLNRGLLRLERGGVISCWTSEHELKSENPGSRQRVTQNSLIKYPDALVYPAGRRGADPVAVELERTLKTRARYVHILSAYAAIRNVSAVLFICETPAIENAVLESARAVYYPFEQRPLGIARAKDWRSDPLAMNVRCGDELMSMRQFLTLHSACTGGRAAIAAE